jgi:anti-anti-sigma factor
MGGLLMIDQNGPNVTVRDGDSVYTLIADDTGELSIPLDAIEAGIGYQTTKKDLTGVAKRRNGRGPVVARRDPDAEIAVIILQVCRDEEVVSVDFGGEEFLGQNVLPTLREKLAAILEDYRPKVLCFDLKGVRMVTAEMLGVLVTMHNKGAKVALLNPSEEVRYVLEITKLNTLLQMTAGER